MIGEVMERIRCIAWDFDGVLNRNVVNGHFIWQDGLSEFGITKELFAEFMFSDGFWPIMRGDEDLLDRVERFLKYAGVAKDGQELLDFWFKADARLCERMLGLMGQVEKAGLRQIIATNNEHRRSQFIENEMGFSGRVEKLYSSGRMGIAKPDTEYFRAIENDLGLSGAEILFVDDYAENTQAAAACGWQVHHFPEDGHDALHARLADIL